LKAVEIGCPLLIDADSIRYKLLARLRRSF
jgi:hypothetical protein